MTKHERVLFWVAEVNCVFWLAAVVCLAAFADDNHPHALRDLRYVCYTGFFLSAFLQHWAYYKIYKPVKQKQKEEKKLTESKEAAKE